MPLSAWLSRCASACGPLISAYAALSPRCRAASDASIPPDSARHPWNAAPLNPWERHTSLAGIPASAGRRNLPSCSSLNRVMFTSIALHVDGTHFRHLGTASGGVPRVRPWSVVESIRHKGWRAPTPQQWGAPLLTSKTRATRAMQCTTSARVSEQPPRLCRCSHVHGAECTRQPEPCPQKIHL